MKLAMLSMPYTDGGGDWPWWAVTLWVLAALTSVAYLIWKHR
jgi:hypothetical protein